MRLDKQGYALFSTRSFILTSSYLKEIVKCVKEGRNGIKAGVIGEIGCNYPLTDDERKCLIAAAKAQVFCLLLVLFCRELGRGLDGFNFSTSC